jgi:hypothetical protein
MLGIVEIENMSSLLRGGQNPALSNGVWRDANASRVSIDQPWKDRFRFL